MFRRYHVPALLLLLFVTVPTPAAAYVGPGVGLTALGAALAVIASIVFGVFGFLWYPLKRLFRSFSKGDEEGDADAADS